MSNDSKGKRGGRRPGAGAPRGNINALRTGQYSKAVREIMEKTGEGILVLDKKRKKLVLLYKEEDLKKLKEGGLSV